MVDGTQITEPYVYRDVWDAGGHRVKRQVWRKVTSRNTTCAYEYRWVDEQPTTQIEAESSNTVPGVEK